MSSEPILLVGAGAIGIEYAKVLRALGKDFIVVGRSDNSAQRFSAATGVMVSAGGLDNWLQKTLPAPQSAIVCVNGDQLGICSRALIAIGVKRLLIEKPAGLDEADILDVQKAASARASSAFVAYNRRHYSSVIAARELILQDGGVTSFNFEFTEWSHVVENVAASRAEKEEWFLQNSTHVVNLAFYLGGMPRNIATYRAGAMPWHPSGAAFAGAGKTYDGALFSYCANWDAPGRWSVELLTPARRLILRPLEKLQVQNRKFVTVEQYPIDDDLDISFKPGLYREVKSFLEKANEGMTTLDEHVRMLPVYRKICPGGSNPEQ